MLGPERQREAIAKRNADLNNTIIRKVEFKDTPLLDVVPRIRSLSGKADDEDGVFILLNGQAEGGDTMFILVRAAPTTIARLRTMTITLDLQNAPLRQVLEAVTGMADLKLLVLPGGVFLTDESD